MAESFKDHPESIAEVRAGKARDAALWSPRDVLISLLREIDGGLEIDAMVIAFRRKGEAGDACYRAAVPDRVVALGLMEIVKGYLLPGRRL